MWSEVSNYSSDKFSGDYFCNHVKEYCDTRVSTIPINDRSLRQYFLAYQGHLHSIIDNKIICNYQPERLSEKTSKDDATV